MLRSTAFLLSLLSAVFAQNYGYYGNNYYGNNQANYNGYNAGGYNNYNQYNNQYNNNQYNNGNNVNYFDDDTDDAKAGYGTDDAMMSYSSSSYQSNNDDSIVYWTNYAMRPMRCIVYNDVDVVLFTMHDEAYQQCSDKPLGTYMVPVPEFMTGYLNQHAQEMQDQGYDDYTAPDVAQYVECDKFEINGRYYYMMLGCSDESTKKIAVNIYEDEYCTKRSSVDGYDDANIDVSNIQPWFGKCQPCVNWVNKDNVDDQFYEDRQKEAPLCMAAWQSRTECGKKCLHTGLERDSRWNTSDQILLVILVAFAGTLVALIMRKRQKMSNKDTLLEHAALNAVGLQQPHVVGVCILVVLVVAVFVLLGLKKVTWVLLLFINTVLFAYMMKLTIDSSKDEALIGPDGQIVRQDSDESSLEYSRAPPGMTPNAGTYSLPTLA